MKTQQMTTIETEPPHPGCPAERRSRRCLHRWGSLLLLSGVLLSHCGGRYPVRSDSASGVNLPVTRVVLYQSGVGYFERTGSIDGNQIAIPVRASQINDILKSLTVLDSAGKALSVSLPLERLASQILDELPLQVREASGLMDVMQVFRGATVQLHGYSGVVRGRILGMEALPIIPEAEGDPAVMEFRVTVQNDRGELVVVPLRDIQRVKMLDRGLVIGLDQSLDVSLNSGSWNPNDVTITLTDDSARQVMISYIVEMPRWKPAYRIVLEEGRKPLLQGWAVVDNVSGEDWNDVHLSLVAGSPMSFQYDLHSPQFTERVDLTPARRRAMAPTIDPPGVSEVLDGSKERDMLQRIHAPTRSAAKRTFADESEDVRTKKDDEVMSDARSQRLIRATGEAVGSLFRYDIPEPLTVPDRSSTLISIVHAEVPGKEVVLFRPELTRFAAGSHPYRAVMFRNDSGFALESGPVAAYSGGTFVGEGFLEQMEKGLTGFVTFSIDSRVTLQREETQLEEGTRLLRIIDGMLTVEANSVRRSRYQISNRHETPVTAFVKSKRMSGYSPRVRGSGIVDTPEAIYVPVTVSPKSKASLDIEWVSPVRRHLSVDSEQSDELLQVFMGSGNVPESIRPILQDILRLRERLTEIAAEAEHLTRQMEMHTRDQDRIRDNLNLLRKTRGNADLEKELSRNLGDIERTLGELSGRRVRLSEEEAGLQHRIRVRIREITLDVK